MIKAFKNFGKSIAVYHGLGSGPDPGRIEYLRSIGYVNIHYPRIDFEGEWYKDGCKSMFIRELRSIKEKEIDLLLGFSIGGYLAFELAGKSSIDLVLVNPAIDRSKTRLDIKYFNIPNGRNFGKIETFLGSKDDLIDRNIPINFLRKNNIKSDIHIIDGMEHGTPPEYFVEIVNKSKLI